jgi:hypothetical protein
MKVSWLIKLKEFIARHSKKPWACFSTNGPDEDGGLEFHIAYNNAFIKKVEAYGIKGVTPEETLQIFFFKLRMAPDDDPVNPEATPNLSNEANHFVR